MHLYKKKTIFHVLHKLKSIHVLLIKVCALQRVIGHFPSIKTTVLQICSLITGDKIDFLSPMMFSN